MTLVPAEIMGLIEGDRHDIVKVTDTDQNDGKTRYLHNPHLSIQDHHDNQDDVIHQSEADNPWL